MLPLVWEVFPPASFSAPTIRWSSQKKNNTTQAQNNRVSSTVLNQQYHDIILTNAHTNHFHNHKGHYNSIIRIRATSIDLLVACTDEWFPNSAESGLKGLSPNQSPGKPPSRLELDQVHRLGPPATPHHIIHSTLHECEWLLERQDTNQIRSSILVHTLHYHNENLSLRSFLNHIHFHQHFHHTSQLIKIHPQHLPYTATIMIKQLQFSCHTIHNLPIKVILILKHSIISTFSRNSNQFCVI